MARRRELVERRKSVWRRSRLPRGSVAAPSKMTQNGLKWLFSVIFRKSIRVHLTRLQMASPGAYLGSWDVYDHKTPLGARFQLYARIGGIFKDAKRGFFDILVVK